MLLTDYTLFVSRPVSLYPSQQSVTQRWLNGQITNFQYLIHLNTLAGRSYNDLSQYPILPWVLADYTSSNLDFTNPKTFRDLSKPMGAQHPQRLEQFLKRYREWDDPTGETPPYMYGTHYSSAMIVVSYLVRLEPFTQQFLSLQGGHFDLADRMFHSIGDAWISASRNNMADVKELIPEFFVLPELLLNKNKFDFGVKQNGVVLDDVVLPPWAHGDAREFVRLHRQALECDYVSSHLHEWIDLVFGYKQNGDEAV
ncbi:Beige/BEACH domain protein, partial [Cooperia oncophora]